MNYNNNGPFDYDKPMNGKTYKHGGMWTGGVIAILVLAAALFMTMGLMIGTTLAQMSDYGAPDGTEAAEVTDAGDVGDTAESRITQPSAVIDLRPLSEGTAEKLTAAEIYKKTVGSVVGIIAEGTYTNIFGQRTTTASSGTGFIISSDGYILTNFHVIEGSNTIDVSLFGGETYTASVVGYEQSNDIAVLKIEATGLSAITVGNSDGIAVGEDIFVIGNPLGELTYTMTRGIISAVGREINTDGTPISMFQIDAAVNSGNSGGPAFDNGGRVVGIVTAKYSSDSVEGLGFCIPVNDAVEIAGDLISHGYVTGKPVLGAVCEDAYDVYAYYSRYYRAGSSRLASIPTDGAYVSGVTASGAADYAGLKEGDFIIAVDGKAFDAADDLAAIISSHKPGDTVILTVKRSGEDMSLTVTLDEYNPASYTYSEGLI